MTKQYPYIGEFIAENVYDYKVFIISLVVGYDDFEGGFICVPIFSFDQMDKSSWPYESNDTFFLRLSDVENGKGLYARLKEDILNGKTINGT